MARPPRCAWRSSASHAARREPGERLRERDLQLSADAVRELRPAELRACAWSLARQRCRNVQLLRAVADTAVERLGREQLRPIEVVGITWALAKLLLRDDSFTSAMTVAAAKMATHQFSPQDLANTAWSCARFR